MLTRILHRILSKNSTPEVSHTILYFSMPHAYDAAFQTKTACHMCLTPVFFSDAHIFPNRIQNTMPHASHVGFCMIPRKPAGSPGLMRNAANLRENTENSMILLQNNGIKFAKNNKKFREEKKGEWEATQYFEKPLIIRTAQRAGRSCCESFCFWQQQAAFFRSRLW